MLWFMEFSLFYGYNNTPLFAYEDNLLDPEVRQALDQALKRNDIENSPFLKKLKAWSDVLKSNNDKLTKEVEDYRQKEFPLE